MPLSERGRPRGLVFIATSLDGFIARQDGGLEWLSIVEDQDEDYGFRAFFDSVDVIVLGRKTYDTVLGFTPWPYRDKRCIVLSHRALEPRHGEERFAGEPSALVQRLGQEGHVRLYVDGGEVVSQFLEAGLIDELTISILPIVLGSGRRLFCGGSHDTRLHLEAARSFPTGLVQVRYRRPKDAELTGGRPGPAPSSAAV